MAALEIVEHDALDATTGQKPEKPTEKPKVDKVQDNQIKKLFALTKEKDLSPEQMKEIMQAKFGKTSSKELTKKEASQLIDMISEVEKEAS